MPDRCSILASTFDLCRQAPEIDRPTVQPRWRPEIDAITSLAEPSRKFQYRHDFETGDVESAAIVGKFTRVDAATSAPIVSN